MSRDPALLLDMLLAARKVQRFNARASVETFARDDLLQSATQYQLQIVGEAACGISAATRAQHPQIPWDQIIGLRHRLVHGYARIDPAKVWSIVVTDIPQLIAALEPLIPPEASP